MIIRKRIPFFKKSRQNCAEEALTNQHPSAIIPSAISAKDDVRHEKKGVAMKVIAVFAVFCSLVLFTFNCETNAAKQEPVTLKTDRDSVSYIVGTDIARSLTDIKDEIDIDMLISGLKDQFSEKPLLVTKEKAQTIMREFSMKMREKMEKENKVLAKRNFEEENKFLKKNKKKKGITTTDSGLQYLVLKQGDGPKPSNTDKVKVHYKGTTVDGTEFDSSYKRGEPVTFPVTGVIKGWTEALLLMNVGSKYKLFIPSELAYGQRGAGQHIGPSTMLIFEVELLGIEK